jgi:polyphosphate kinase
VLQEAKDHSLPLYERIKFLAIYTNNLEEFYKVRVAEHRSIMTIDADEVLSMQVAKAKKTLEKIHTEVTRQTEEFSEIFSAILPELESHNIILCDGKSFKAEHKEYITRFFNEEVLPFLQPVMVKEGEIYSFLRDNRVYISVCMYKKSDTARERPKYAAVKLPYSKVSRFIQLPELEEKHYIAFQDDIIKMNLNTIFPGYVIDGAYTIRVSRDADLMIEDELDGNLANKIERSLSRRKTGAPSRFLHEKGMPAELVKVIRHAFNIHKTDVVEGGYYLSLEDLFSFPNPVAPLLEKDDLLTVKVPQLDKDTSLFKVIKEQDVILHYPYHSYDYLIRFLMEASFDGSVEEIMVTQYRVASNSAVVNSLISAAQNGKRVTVFVELKARFDEETNLHSAMMMKKAGIKIIYSIPNLKVHSKVALVVRKGKSGRPKTSLAYLSTGNFNEKTAKEHTSPSK